MATLRNARAHWLPMTVLGCLLGAPLLVMGAAPAPAGPTRATAPSSSATPPPAKATSIYSRIATCQQSCDVNASGEDGRAVCKLSCMKREGLTRKTDPVLTGRARATTPGPAPAATVTSPAPATRPPSYASCRSECAAGPPSAVNTCLLNCESARKHEAQKAAATSPTASSHGPGGTVTSAPPPSPRPTERAPSSTAGSVTGKATVTQTSSSSSGRTPAQIASCKQSCDTEPGVSDTDRATCKLGCESSGARSSSFTVTGSPAQIRCYKACACESDCAKSQASCTRSCETMSDDGARASCKLQCEASANSCPKRCPEKAQGCTCG